MGRLFAIGGGEIADRETESTDRAILDATDTSEPHVVFLPTASGDADDYVEKFGDYYESLGATTETVRVAGPTDASVRDALDRADAVYVGGGATAFMLDVWRTRGIDDALREAFADGTVLSGLSAGALCWFAGGLSDAVPLDTVEYGAVSGLGFVDRHATVHADWRRRERFREYLAARDATGVALGDATALEVRDDEWRVHTSSPVAAAFRVTPDDGEQLPADGEYRSLAEL